MDVPLIVCDWVITDDVNCNASNLRTMRDLLYLIAVRALYLLFSHANGEQLLTIVVENVPMVYPHTMDAMGIVAYRYYYCASCLLVWLRPTLWNGTCGTVFALIGTFAA